MVPTFTCGLLRSNFSFATGGYSFLKVSGTYYLRAGPDRLTGAVLDDLLGDVRRHLVVPIELHGVCGSSLGRRAQVCRVAEHRRQRDAAPDGHGVAARLLALDVSAAAGQVADH